MLPSAFAPPSLRRRHAPRAGPHCEPFAGDLLEAAAPRGPHGAQFGECAAGGQWRLEGA